MYCFWSLCFLYLYLYTFLPPSSFGSTVSCSSRALNYVIKSFTWDRSDFLVWAHIAINFCVKTALAISQRLKFKWKHRKVKDFDLNLKAQKWKYPVQNLDLYGTTMWVLCTENYMLILKQKLIPSILGRIPQKTEKQGLEFQYCEHTTRVEKK